MSSRINWRVAGLAVLVLALAGCGYNSILGADEDVKAAWAEVQNQYQRRMELIPNLVSTVKGAADFEQEALQAVVEARSQAAKINLDPKLLEDPAAFQRFQQAQDQLGGALQRLMVVVERYPQLGATEAFRDLQAQLEGTENRIAVARRDYIEAVRIYNTTRRRFPANVIAGMFGFEKQPQLEFDAAERETPQVEFDFGDDE